MLVSSGLTVSASISSMKAPPKSERLHMNERLVFENTSFSLSGFLTRNVSLLPTNQRVLLTLLPVGLHGCLEV